jgi:hypothetical protein
MNRALGVSTAFVSQGSFDALAPLDGIANSLALRLESEATACARPVQNGAAVDIDFGQSCRLATGAFDVGGTVHAEVTRTTEVVITLTLALTVDGGQALTGTFTIYSGNANAFTYGGDTTLDGRRLRAPSLRSGISMSGASLVFTGGTLESANGTLPLDANGVRQRFAACYAAEGNYLLRPDGGAQSSLAFDGNAPQTGIAVLDGRPIALPDRTGCPPR